MNGIKIKDGVVIRIPVFDIHYDPKTWKDPETFDPERYISPCTMTHVLEYHLEQSGY